MASLTVLENGLDDLEGVEQFVGRAPIKELRPVDLERAILLGELESQHLPVELNVRREHLDELPGFLGNLLVVTAEKTHELIKVSLIL